MEAPKQYVKGQDRKLDELVAAYDAIDPKLLNPEEEPERTASDPLGLTEKRTPPPEGSWTEAQSATDKLLRAFFHIRSAFELGAESTIYATELFALNVLNAKDCPISQDKANEIRRAAYEYYMKHTKGP